MTLRVDGGAPGVEIRNNVFTLSTKLGRFVELPNLFIGFPKLYMQIIDRPSPDQAILAIGEKIKASDKSS